MAKVKFDILLDYIQNKLIAQQQESENFSNCINSVLNCAINFRDLEFIETIDIALENDEPIFTFGVKL